MTKMKKPRALKPGDTIGLIAPSGSLKDLAQADQGVAALTALGFRIKMGGTCRSVYGYLAGGDAARAADLNAFFADPTVDGIVCLKGGYGTPRILDLLDYGVIARNPKVFVGYSDITGLHLALNRMCSLVTFHGPMAVSMIPEFDPFSRYSWMSAVSEPRPLGTVVNPSGTEPLYTIVGGTARGPVIGGNLSLVAATMGTQYQIDARGKILFFEDIDEAPYRVDRMLTQLRLAGVFDQCAGVILGNWNNCVAQEGRRTLELRQVFEDVIAQAGKPTVAGLRAGHCVPTHTLPFGVEVVLRADEPALEFVEAATV